ncbi:nascent polypeptide-associated complex subunit alpha, muscle-specific form-like [Lepus europaeus]|uniref:nascent polypeptide-associated complex subunit alpha, muscle-specific form-like n=1 Tax=Lepus europaeus TaxID=9983 RepID=UPI002B4912EB|nr:nascent polypeptide-associated complex subunit alpha, muscle-specific form-like [Lepus europaeus]
MPSQHFSAQPSTQGRFPLTRGLLITTPSASGSRPVPHRSRCARPPLAHSSLLNIPHAPSPPGSSDPAPRPRDPAPAQAPPPTPPRSPQTPPPSPVPPRSLPLRSAGHLSDGSSRPSLSAAWSQPLRERILCPLRSGLVLSRSPLRKLFLTAAAAPFANPEMDMLPPSPASANKMEAGEKGGGSSERRDARRVRSYKARPLSEHVKAEVVELAAILGRSQKFR